MGAAAGHRCLSVRYPIGPVGYRYGGDFKSIMGFERRGDAVNPDPARMRKLRFGKMLQQSSNNQEASDCGSERPLEKRSVNCGATATYNSRDLHDLTVVAPLKLLDARRL